MLPRQRCPFCRRWYHPQPRLNRRQRTCGRPECRRQQKQRSNQQWRAKNPDHFRGSQGALVSFVAANHGNVTDLAQGTRA